eukprot:g1973.t1
MTAYTPEITCSGYLWRTSSSRAADTSAPWLRNNDGKREIRERKLYFEKKRGVLTYKKSEGASSSSSPAQILGMYPLKDVEAKVLEAEASQYDKTTDQGDRRRCRFSFMLEGPSFAPIILTAETEQERLSWISCLNSSSSSELFSANQESVRPTLRMLVEMAKTSPGQDNNLWVESVYQVGDNLVSATKVLITGIGKSGYVARRMAASMSSVGIASQYVHGTEWFHGDLGSLGENDAVVAFSHSGNTKELCDLFGYLRSDSFAPSRIPFLAAIVGTQKCTLSNIADVALVAPAEGELLGAVPSRSIVSQEAAVNAILSAVVQRTGFDSSGFGRNHPGVAYDVVGGAMCFGGTVVVDELLKKPVCGIEDDANPTVVDLALPVSAEVRCPLTKVPTVAGGDDNALTVPVEGQRVTVAADLALASGTKIWSTHKSSGFLFSATSGPQPFSYSSGTGGVIKGWDDGVATMKVGERSVLEIPWKWAYGERGHPGFKIPAKADLVFEIERLS